MLEPLPRSYIGMLLPFSSPTCLAGGVHRTVWLLKRVCSITWFGLFSWLGCFLSPRIVWSNQTPQGVYITGGIGDLCQPAPSPPERLIGASLLIPAPQRADWTSPGAHWNCQAWSSCRSNSFRSSDRICRSAVLLNYRPSSIRLADVSGPIIAQHWRRKRDKVLVLAMIIYHPSYLMFLTFCVAFLSKCTTHI